MLCLIEGSLHLSKTPYRIWKYVDFCALKTNLFITNQRQILPWRVFPVNCFHSIYLIWLLGYQFLRFVEHLFHCEIFCISNGMPMVCVILHHEYRCFQWWRHEQFTISQNVLRCLLLHLLRIFFAFFALDRSPCARMIWIRTTILIPFCVFNDELMRSTLRANNGSHRSIIHQSIRFQLLRRPIFSNVPFWVGWWVFVCSGSVALVTRVPATTGFPVLSYFSACELRGLRLSCLDFSGLSGAVEDSADGALSCFVQSNSSLVLTLALSSPDSFCVLFDITSEHFAELKWLVLNKHKKMIPFVTCEISFG